MEEANGRSQKGISSETEPIKSVSGNHLKVFSTNQMLSKEGFEQPAETTVACWVEGVEAERFGFPPHHYFHHQLDFLSLLMDDDHHHLLPRNTNIPISCATRQRVVYAVRLQDELVERLKSSSKPRLCITLDPSQPPLNNTLWVDGVPLGLTTVTEAQKVDVAQVQDQDGQVRVSLLGSIKYKLVMRQELVQARVAQIRQQTEDAERARLSRKTVTLEDRPTVVKKKTRTAISKSVSLSKMRASSTLTPSRAQSHGNMMVPPPSFTASKTHSERDSQNSWSPVLTEHAVIPGKTLASLLDRPKRIDSKATTDRKPPTDHLLPPRTTTDTKASAIHHLEEEFGRRYHEYITLNRWMDNRLNVFSQLQGELSRVADHSKAQEQVIFRVVVEDRRLKDDREYRANVEKLEECCAALMMIKARLAALVKSS